MNTENTCCCCCGDDENKNFNKKNEFVEKFIQLLKDTPLTVNVSSRQVAIYGRLIKMLGDAPRTLTMKDVRQRFIQAEDDMYCPCREERGRTGYITIFDGLWTQLRHLLHQEIEFLFPCECDLEEKEPAIVCCWEYNHTFNASTKKYYDGMVELHFMNEDYSWTENADNSIKAYWIDKFCQKVNVPNKWAWASKVWGIGRLKSSFYNSALIKNREIFVKIDKIFE